MRCAHRVPGAQGWRHRMPRALGGSILLPAAVCVAGCGGGETDALKKRVSALKDEVALLQNAQDRLEERLAALEMRRQEATERSTTTGSSAGKIERPRLKVIKVEPGFETPATEPSPAAEPEPPAEGDHPDAPRPVIRGTGDRVESQLPAGPTSRLDRAGAAMRDLAPVSGQNLDQCYSIRSRGA